MDNLILPAPIDSADRQPHAGRPALYDPSYCAMVIEYMARNHSLTAFAGKIRVSPRTVFNWLRLHPDFKEAVEVGRAARTGTIEDRMNSDSITGPQAMLAWKQATNVAPEEYQDKQTVAHEHDSNGGANIYLKQIADSIGRVCDQAAEALERSKANARLSIRPDQEVIEAQFDDVIELENKKGAEAP